MLSQYIFTDYSRNYPKRNDLNQLVNALIEISTQNSIVLEYSKCFFLFPDFMFMKNNPIMPPEIKFDTLNRWNKLLNIFGLFNGNKSQTKDWKILVNPV